MQVGEKVEKSRITVFFSNELSPEFRAVGSLQRRVRSHLARWEMKNCTQFWREAHVEVKIYKTPQHRSTFRSWNVEKVHAIVARSTFPSQKCPKTHGPGPLLDVQMSCRVAGASDFAPCQKWGKREGFVALSKMLAGLGLLKRICKDAFRVAGAAEMLGGQAADFLREVAFWRVRLSGLLRWFCVTGAALRMIWHHWFVAGAILRWNEKIAKRIGTRPSALHSMFHFWRRSRKIASFLMLSTSKIEEVSQNCFVFDVVNFENWGSLAELLRFWWCHLRKWKKPCRIALFPSLQVNRQIDRQLQLPLPLHCITATITNASRLRYITQH